MAHEPFESWVTIWPSFLLQAARCAVAETRDPNMAFGNHAAAIILAQSSWETFKNEFIESRDLPQRIKRKPLIKAIPSICRALKVEEFSFREGTLWEALLCAARLRNAVVHHEAQPLRPGQAPMDLFESMQRHCVISASNSDGPWERLLITSRSATWCCTVVGNAILELERIPTRRRRTYSSVEQSVCDALGGIA